MTTIHTYKLIQNFLNLLKHIVSTFLILSFILYLSSCNYNQVQTTKIHVSSLHTPFSKKNDPISNYKNKDSSALGTVDFWASNDFVHLMEPHYLFTNLYCDDGKETSEEKDTSFEGIGALLRGGGNIGVVVVSPLAGSPALNAGLRRGDIIRKVDGLPIKGMSLPEVVKRIRGPRQTVVILYIERPSKQRSFNISITRDVIKQAVTYKKVLDKNGQSGLRWHNEKLFQYPCLHYDIEPSNSK